MKKLIAITAVAFLALAVTGCASTGATTSAGGHSSCSAYGNP